MINFFDWVNSDESLSQDNWLILGKGPSIDCKSKYDLRDSIVVGLNDVVRDNNCDIVHIVDLSVLDRVREVIQDKAKYLLMPAIPHEDYHLPGINKTLHRKSKQTLAELAKSDPTIRSYNERSSLLFYDTSQADDDNVRHVKLGSFSASTVVRLLAQSGVRTIRTLGIDGGSNYSPQYRDLEEISLLDAGQDSYNAQFDEIAHCIMQYDLDFAPLNIEHPVKVYVGTQPEQMLATHVLEYSIRKHASMSVEVYPLHTAISENNINIELQHGRTPFSFQRFAIPELQGYTGRAIYLDSDMQVFRDIRELWAWPMQDSEVVAVKERKDERREPGFSVMLIDTEKARWSVSDLQKRIAQGEFSYEEVLYQMKHVANIGRTLPNEWNDLENFSKHTRLIHYTDMIYQPWISIRNRHAKIWCAELIEAIITGYIDIALVEEHITKGWIRPSLRYQIEHKIADPLLLPKHILKLDIENFVPPLHLPGTIKAMYEGEGAIQKTGLVLYKLLARLLYIWQQSGMQLAVRKLKLVIKKIGRLIT